MKYGPDKESSRSSVSMFAVTFVVMGGIGFYVALFGMYDVDPWYLLGMVAGGVGLILIAFWVGNSQRANHLMNTLFFAHWKRDIEKNKLDWQPKKVRSYKKEELGTKKPPSTEAVREMGQGNNTWVPREKLDAKRDGKKKAKH